MVRLSTSLRPCTGASRYVSLRSGTPCGPKSGPVEGQLGALLRKGRSATYGGCSSLIPLRGGFPDPILWPRSTKGTINSFAKEKVLDEKLENQDST